MTDQQPPTDSSPKLPAYPDANFALQAAGVGTWDLDIVHRRVWWDARCRELYGFEQADVVPYEQVLSYMHPDDQSRVDAAVQWALTPQSGGHYDIQFRTVGASNGQLRWLQCRGRAFFNEQGEANRFSGIAQDITQLVLANLRLGDSQARFTDLVMATPVATAVYSGREMLIQQINAPMLAIWGKDESVIGKALSVALPELDGQPFLSQLQHVFDTGEPFRHTEGVADMIENGQPKRVWFNHAYNPLYDESGRVYGVINTALDVTDQVVARQVMEDKEMALSNTIELAQLGTFSVDIATNQLTVSPRVADWFGFDRLVADTGSFINGVGERDRELVQTRLNSSLLAGSGGRYDVIHSVVHAKSGHQIIIHALGQVYFDAEGTPLRLEGTAQDITAQQQLQLVLEQQVHLRTQELAASGKKLAASNEELLATNKDFAAANQTLEWINQDLIRSNQNLEQFAYIASHDLQEPLRKIQQFSDLLQGQYSEALGEGTNYLKRMQVAASRMSLLIKDLLAFSRIATNQVVARSIPLIEVINIALDNLSVVIEASQAQIEIGELPTVQGDELQLGQLFQNLLSNALKFRRVNPDGTFIFPRIEVRARLVRRDELPALIRPSRSSDTYHLIEVTDNGIGFEEKYLDRIFQVFQRLHGKNEFAGTGVGLAIVQKVVINHGGAITASGKANQGATFCVYLPA